MFVTLFLAATMPLVVLMVGSPKKKTPERPVPTEATVHLDRFAKALQSAKANKPKRDSTLHSYFTKKN
jgi:hypothetical protein